MVEQILMFAKSRDGLRKYDLRPAHAGRIVESTLAKLLPAMDQAGFTVENQIKSDLPQVIVDEAALSQCLENLINNAIKYGGSNRWMRVSSTSISTDQGDEVQISVEDKGLGIDRTDLPHIFDPFYRGAAAAVAQIHGSGLGLSLAREGVTAMGGRITVKSTPDVGSVFTIHLPTCEREEDKVTHSEAS